MSIQRYDLAGDNGGMIPHVDGDYVKLEDHIDSYIFDEAKEIELFNKWFLANTIGHLDKSEISAAMIMHASRDVLRVGWLACAKSRANQ